MLRNPNKTSESQWLGALETCSRAGKSLILRAVNASSLIKVSCPDYGDGAVGLGLVWLGARAMGRFNAGIPAKVIREMSDQELAWKANGTREYKELAQRCLTSLREFEPLLTLEPDRQSHSATATVPLNVLKKTRAQFRVPSYAQRPDLSCAAGPSPAMGSGNFFTT